MAQASRTVEGLMGTRVVVGGEARWGRAAAAACDRAIAELRRLQAIFSIFDPASELSRMRHGRLGSPGAELTTLIRAAQLWASSTSGAFGVTVEPIRALWEQAARDDRVPGDDEVRAAAASAAAGHTRHLNLNAIAKGWSVDRAVGEALGGGRGRPADSVWVNAGGDIAHRGAGSVTVGIEDPRMPYDNVEPLVRVRVANQALATSGGTRRYVTIDGRRFGHVLDPRTGHPVGHIAQASVLAPTAEAADVWATAATVLEADETIDRLAAEAATEAMVIHTDGTIHTTPGWPESGL